MADKELTSADIEDQMSATDSEEQEHEEDAKMSENEELARSMGWRPKDQYDGNEDDWIEADEYVARAPLYKNMSKQRRTIRKLEKQIQALADHNRRISQATKDHQLEQLRAARREAMENRDADEVEEIEKQISETEKVEVSDPTADINTVFEDWKDDNEWYDTDPDLQAIANNYGSRLKQQNPNLPDAELLEKVSEYINDKYLSKDEEEPKRTRVPDGGTAPKRRAAGSKSYVPTAEERTLAREFVSMGVYKNEAEYYKQLEMIQAAKRR